MNGNAANFMITVAIVAGITITIYFIIMGINRNKDLHVQEVEAKALEKIECVENSDGTPASIWACGYAPYGAPEEELQ